MLLQIRDCILKCALAYSSTLPSVMPHKATVTKPDREMGTLETNTLPFEPLHTLIGCLCGMVILPVGLWSFIPVRAIVSINGRL